MKMITFLCLLASMNSIAADKRFNTDERVKNYSKAIPNKWKDLINPKTEEFWREGNHVPDKGLLLLAQEPENIQYAKLWLLRMEIKAKHLNQMQKTIEIAQKQMVQDGLMEDRYWQFQDLIKGKTSSRITKRDLKNFNIYFLFSSTCPHCKSLSKNLSQIPNVKPLQVNEGKLLNFKGLDKTTRASVETKSTYLKNGVVPVVVIHNPKNNLVTTVSGNRPINEYLYAASTILKGGK
jgi:hypothetical protein